MNRIREFIIEYFDYVVDHQEDIEKQVELLTEMLKDFVLEDRLRTINILEVSGIPIEPKHKNMLLEGAIDGF